MNAKRLSQLRDLMKQHEIDYYYIPSADEHRNEYVPNFWERRAWISGFDGSAGDVLVGKDGAWLWTDGRYSLQAEQQLDLQHFELKISQQGVPPIDHWLKHIKQKIRVGVDPKLFTISQQKRFTKALASNKSELISIDENLVDRLWQDKPETLFKPILCLDVKYTGKSSTEKLAEVRTSIAKNGADSLVLTKLDAIAWLFNIRGNDVAYNPLVISYAIVSQDEAFLFIDLDKVSDDNKEYFKSQSIQLKNYHAFSQALNQLSGKVLLDPSVTSWWTKQQLKHADIIFATNPITHMKAIKNPTEQAGMREAHRIDAIAMIKFLHWIETHWQDGITEIDAATELEKFRRDDARCKDLSFDTISGFAGNGAIIHYRSSKESNKTIDDSALFLVDSGGQYYEGTTDITRTIHLGQPTEEEKRFYTLVLKGHLALRHARFPEGCFGENLDILARKPLWDAGENYAHGTGHGVGCYLCVHEGPQAISQRSTRVPLEAGMVVSNEPGVYFRDRFGIRIENLCLIVPDPEKSVFYTLEDLTLVPYARHLIATDLLNNNEIQWINNYHHQIFESIQAELSPTLREWLQEATKPLKSNR